MTARCEDLDPFFDRELPSEAGLAFREHLTRCARCQKVLRGRMLEAAMIAGAADRASAESAPASAREPIAAAQHAAPRGTLGERIGRWRRYAVATGTAAIAMAAAGLMTWRPGPSAPAAPAISLADERGVEVRFSAPALDRHRRYAVVRAAGSAAAVPHERIGLSELAELERRGELNMLVGASALNGDLASAERTAGELPKTAPSLTDRAAIELLRDTSATDIGSPRTQAAERALSLTTDALRIDPAYAPARWNQALALRRLGLALVAARVFDEIAELREAGWADEARGNADLLRRDYQRTTDDWRRTKADADQMVLGGAVLAADAIARAPSLARDAFYKALATASTLARIDELRPLARALDAQFATTALRDLLARVRASDLRSRAPVAADLRAFLKLRKPAEAINELRARALDHDIPDIVLASFLVIDAADTDDSDLALLDQLVIRSRDPWWRLVQLARRAHVLEFDHRDYAAVDAAERIAGPICKSIHSTWCGRIMRLAGGANSQMGRADLAIEQITAARRQATEAAVPDDEIAALEALGQAVAIRVADDVDSGAVAGAYLEEVALRNDTCTTRLRRLDFAATAALQHHRFAQAARARHDSDVLEQERCQDEQVRLNGETARVQLVLHGQATSIETLRTNLARLDSGHAGWKQQALYVEFLRAAATLAEDRPRGELALRQVIADSDADPARPFARQVRALAFDAIVESIARSDDAKAVLALLTERLRTPSFDRCVVGVAAWNRLVVAVLDADGRPALDTREIPEGVVMVPPSEVVSPALRARLDGCRRVEVVTPGAYFGTPRLLGGEVAWVYRSGTPRPASARGPTRELVIAEATPPEDLQLPALRPFAGLPGAELVSDRAATPANVLAAMQTASLIVVVAHGLTDANEPTAASLILSPDAQGDYLLTASKVSAVRLSHAPVVVLAGCDAGRVQVSAQPWSLATSFVDAGARVVIAPTEPIPDASANEVFRSLVERIRAGADPADALALERRTRGAVAPWLSSIVVFE